MKYIDLSAEILCLDERNVLFSSIYIDYEGNEIVIIGGDRILQEKEKLNNEQKERLLQIAEKYRSRIQEIIKDMTREIKNELKEVNDGN